MADQPQLAPNPIYKQKYIKKGHSNWVRSVAFSPEGQHLASASDDTTIKVWEVESGTLINTLHGHSDLVLSVAFSPDGKRLASASRDETLRIWDRSSGANVATLMGHSDTIWGTAFSRSGALLASASYDGTVRLWDTTSESEVANLKSGNDKMFSIAFSPDSRYVASGTLDSVNLWEVASGAKVRTLEGHTGTVTSVAFSPDGSLLSSTSYDKTIRLWNVASGENIATIREHSGYVESVAFSPDGALLVSGSRDGTICLWDVTSASRISIVSSCLGWVRSVAFSPDGSHIGSGLEDGTVRLWQRVERTGDETPDTGDATVTPESGRDPTNAESSSAGYTTIENDISNLVTLVDSHRIGSGGFGDLFLGTHVEFGKVAMKRPHVLVNEAALRRFLREVELWRGMSHRYILPYLGTCKIDREVYMVSPFIENGDLMSCIQRGMALNRRNLLYEVAEALAHLHHRGIVHGDVKAQNVLLSNDGSALLCDFGLAKAFDTMVTSTEARGSGSVRWMAPELLTGKSGRSMVTDVYSFGITIAEVLSGTLPFEDTVENTAVIFDVVLKDARPPKAPLNSPEGKSYSLLWETAEKCWVSDPKDRPFMAEVLGMLFPLTREK